MTGIHPVALVTGSATGVGRACAVRLAKLGYDVVVNYSRSQTEAEQTLEMIQQSAGNTRPALFQCDVAQEDQVAEMVSFIEDRFGRLDVLVNNAARTKFIPHTNLSEMTSEIWDQILAVNLKGPFSVVRAAADLLAAGDGGAIVNVSSVAGTTGRGSCIAYAASKAV